MTNIAEFTAAVTAGLSQRREALARTAVLSTDPDRRDTLMFIEHEPSYTLTRHDNDNTLRYTATQDVYPACRL